MFSELVALFISGFISSTLFPGGSELLLIYYLNNNIDNSGYYFCAVTLGNSLGAMATYLMGYYFSWGRHKAQAKHQKTIRLCKHYGVYALVLSWLPLIGDWLPLIAGWLKLPILKSMFFIVSGKAFRYALIIISTLYFI